MKKIALVAALAAVSASAFAQSTVTLYGRINTTVESQKFENLPGRTEVVANNSSRIGFKGTEDIGGGLKASFVLEHGFNSDDGKATHGNSFWARESSVQLSGGFGAVRLGNWTPGSYYATADYISMHNHDTGSSSDYFYGGPSRSSNKVGYFTPTMGGFNAEIAVSAGEGAPGVKRGVDLAANYVAGPMHLGAGYSKEGDNNQFAVRGLYELGAITLGAYYQRVDTNNVKHDVYRLSGMYAMGASEFHVNYGHTENFDASGAKGSQFTLGYNYNLSKRTKVYGYYTARDAKLANKEGDFTSLAAGVRHNF